MSDVPTIIDAGKDPLDVLRTVAKFVADHRGIAEILDDGKRIALAVLCRQPEKEAVPVFDVATRAITVGLLLDWLRQRGYEASACRWVQKRRFPTDWTGGNEGLRWELHTGKPAVPEMPPDFDTGPPDWITIKDAVGVVRHIPNFAGHSDASARSGTRIPASNPVEPKE